MPYVTSIERMGIEKGEKQGAARVLVCLLVQRFGPLPAVAEERLAQASIADLERWAGRVLNAQHLDDVFASE